MRYLAMFLIRCYQWTLSPDHGMVSFFYPNGYCRFHPTCSMYAHGSLASYGMLKGAWLSAKRLSRCHPWSSGGIDPVP